MIHGNSCTKEKQRPLICTKDVSLLLIEFSMIVRSGNGNKRRRTSWRVYQLRASGSYTRACGLPTTYSVVYYEGEGKDRHQVWDSGLNYSAAKARKAQLEYEVAQNTHVDRNDMTLSEFLYEFIEKYGEKKWVASTYDGNVGLLENYVHPYLGDQKLRSIRTKTVDDFYHFLYSALNPS